MGFFFLKDKTFFGAKNKIKRDYQKGCGHMRRELDVTFEHPASQSVHISVLCFGSSLLQPESKPRLWDLTGY